MIDKWRESRQAHPMIPTFLKVLHDGLEKGYRRYDSQTGEILEHGMFFEELADYLPAIAFYDDKSRFEQEVTRAIDYLRGNGGLHHHPLAHKLPFLNRCYYHTDFIWGLLLAARMSRAYFEPTLSAVRASTDVFLDPTPALAVITHWPIASGHRLPRRLMIRIPILSAEDHGMFIELLVRCYELSGDSDFLVAADALFQRFANTQVFQERLYFPFFTAEGAGARMLVRRVGAFRKRENHYQLLKQNSNLLFGLMRLQRQPGHGQYESVIKDVLDQWLSDYFDDTTGVYYTNMDHGTGLHGADLTVFHIIELLIMSWLRFGDEGHRAHARDIADSWLQHIDPGTGLLPFLRPGVKQSLKRFGASATQTWLDAMIDFGVALVRLGEATGSERYIDCARDLHWAIDKYHRKEHGYCTSVNVSTGEVLDSANTTKMTALVCKLEAALMNRSSINDECSLNWDLLQDR